VALPCAWLWANWIAGVAGTNEPGHTHALSEQTVPPVQAVSQSPQNWLSLVKSTHAFAAAQ
jgi:hypothetical protein